MLKYMKIILFILLFSTPLLCEDKPGGWTSRIKDSVDVTAGLIEGVEVKKEHRNGENIVTIINKTANAIHYSGYGDAPQTFLRTKSDGKWVDGSWAWCGTGLSKRMVKKDESVTATTAYPNSDQTMWAN